MRFQNKKAPGPDSKNEEIRKHLPTKTRRAIARNFTHCLQLGIFPKGLKIAEVKMLYKGKGKDPKLASSYRPVCLINTMGKLFERIIHDRITAHLADIDMPHESQYGFRKGRSTTDAICRINRAVCASDAKYTMGILIDFSNAFNCMEWNQLRKRLHKIALPPE